MRVYACACGSRTHCGWATGTDWMWAVGFFLGGESHRERRTNKNAPRGGSARRRQRRGCRTCVHERHTTPSVQNSIRTGAIPSQPNRPIPFMPCITSPSPPVGVDSIHAMHHHHHHHHHQYLSASSLGAVQPSTSPAESGRACGTVMSLCLFGRVLLGVFELLWMCLGCLVRGIRERCRDVGPTRAGGRPVAAAARAQQAWHA